jgi:subtilisin family serine protease
MNAAKTLLATATLAALAACSDTSVTAVQPPDGAAPARGVPQHVAPIRMGQAGAAVEGKYIVVLKDGADARGVARAVQARPEFVYESALDGFAGELNRGQLEALQHDPRVAYIEQDQVIRSTGWQDGAPWGLDRIDQRRLPLSGTYYWSTWGNTNSGLGVTVYVFDTGISRTHPEFGGRVQVGRSFIPFTSLYDTEDCNGHGTHVAGIIGASTYGVAKRVSLVPLRMMSCDGTGYSSILIAAMDWLKRYHAKKAVANLSLVGARSDAVNTAAYQLTVAGVMVVTSAGNNGASPISILRDACAYSPQSAQQVVVVAASDRNDARASFSSQGSCVDLYAPGVDIRSTWLYGGTRVLSGTSQAAPHVTGTAALIISVQPYWDSLTEERIWTLESWLKQLATAGVITGNPTGTPNRLLFKDQY